MKTLPIIIFLLLFSFMTPAWSQNYSNMDTVYDGRIHSVKVYDDMLIQLAGSDYFTITFDLLADRQADVYYKIQHCDRFWKPSRLQKNEYLDGFDDREVRDFEFVQARYSAYYNYQLSLPNQQTDFRKSGNYLIHFYDANGNQPLFTRRVIIYEDLVQVKPQLLRGTDLTALQALEIDIDLKKHQVRDPKQDLATTIIQNGNWYTAQLGLQSNFFMGNELQFQRRDIQFPAGKQLRTLDARYVRTRGRDVEEVTEYEDGYEILKRPDRPMRLQNFFNEQDLNGNYFFENGDNPSASFRFNNIQYVDVSIVLEDFTPGINEELYLVGGFTNWQCLPQYQMKYLSTDNLWEAYFRVKQGLYDYGYAIKDTRRGKVDYYSVDGDWYETRNLYQIIVYQKTWEASSYDRVIGVGVVE